MKIIFCLLLIFSASLFPSCTKTEKPGEPAQAPAGVTNPYETQMKVLNKAKDAAAMAKERVAAEQEREKALGGATGEQQ